MKPKAAGKVITLSPITRANGPGWVEVTVSGGKIVDARCSGVFFRGFEIIMQGRDPRDASYLTQRICGICSTAHGTAASMALEDAAGVRPPHNGNLLRNLIYGADFLQNHIRHFYLLGLPDYVQGPEMRPFVPAYTRDFRLDKKQTAAMTKNYLQAIEMSRVAHEMVALLGAKAPHQQGVLAGGSTVPASADVILDFRSKLSRVNAFLREAMVPDAYALGEAYPDYYHIGSRRANLLEFGLFPLDEHDTQRSFPAGVVIDGRLQGLDPSRVTEHFKYSWFAGDEPLHPMESRTVPDREKGGAYSWIKAPRYNGLPFEGGPLARLWIRGDYRKGASTMDRIVARALEAEKIGRLMEGWLENVKPGEAVFNEYRLPRDAEGVGLTGAMRGPLGHWVHIRRGRIAHYQVITPTAWNFSPRDDRGEPGPIEEALLETPVADANQPVEIGRVIRAFDVCFACSTHVIMAGSPTRGMVIRL